MERGAHAFLSNKDEQATGKPQLNTDKRTQARVIQGAEATVPEIAHFA